MGQLDYGHFCIFGFGNRVAHSRTIASEALRTNQTIAFTCDAEESIWNGHLSARCDLLLAMARFAKEAIILIKLSYNPHF